jgi:hypothetical protein
MMNDDAERARDLLRAARQAREERQRARRMSRGERAHEDLSRTGRFLWQVWLGLRWLWQTLGAPVGRALWRVGAWVLDRYRFYVWSRFVYRRTPDGVLRFSATRAGLTLGATWFVLWFLALPVTECVLWDAPLYALTRQVNETVYLQGSQELDPGTASHSIKGCESLPCSDTQAVYFRVESDLFSNLWSLVHGHGFFFPEYVAAAVPYETNRCTITSYGFRFRGTARFLNVFPQLLAVSCHGAGGKM